MAYLRSSAYSSSSDDETPSLQCSTTDTTTTTSTFEITPNASTTSVLTADEQLKSRLVQEGVCCCVSAEDISGNQMDQPLVGWEGRRVESSEHSISSQVLESSLTIAEVVDSSQQLYQSASCSEKASKSTHPSRGRVSLLSLEPKSQLRKYIHAPAVPHIPYIFRHHDTTNGNTSQYMEDYKNCYTYPNMEEKSKKISTVVNSNSTAAAVKPTLFVLGRDLIYQPLQSKVYKYK